MDKKRILVCGAGSIGIYLGTKLSLRGHDVSLLGKNKLRELKETVIINKKKYILPKKLFKIPKNYETDFVFITTKIYDFDHMIQLIKKSKMKYSRIAAIQNGLINLSEYSKYLNHKIVPITVFSGFNLVNGKILVKPTKIGWITEPTLFGREISSLLLDAGINCNTQKNFDSLRAEKIIVNCSLNALSAIENKPFCDLFKNKKITERIYQIFEEAYSILSRKYKLGNLKTLEKRMFNTWSKLKHYSSTCQDIRSKRKNEIKFLNGYIVELGKKYSLSIENNQTLIKDVNKLISGKFKN